MKGNRKNWKKWITVLSAVLVMYLFSVSVSGAAVGVSMPALDGESGTLTLHFGYTLSEDTIEDISGAVFSIYRVADLSVTDGNAVYSLLDKYQGLNISFDGMTASESMTAAELLSDLAKSGNPDNQGETGEDGCVTFEGLTAGMYLVIQSGSNGEALHYSMILPFLVSVPEGSTEGESGIWNYNVKAEPKTEIEKKPVPDISVTPVPSVTAEPSVTPVPSVTPEPSVTPVPSVTPEPSVTSVPDVTPVPSEVPVPSVTSGPNESPAPSVTPVPSVTPEVSITPKLSVTPGTSVTPKATITPGGSTTITPTPGSGGGTNGGTNGGTTGGSSTGSTTVVKTADNTPIAFWTVIFLISAIGSVYLYMYRKHQNTD